MAVAVAAVAVAHAAAVAVAAQVDLRILNSIPLRGRGLL